MSADTARVSLPQSIMSQGGKAAHERCVGGFVIKLADNIGAVLAQRHRMKDNTRKRLAEAILTFPKEWVHAPGR